MTPRICSLLRRVLPVPSCLLFQRIPDRVEICPQGLPSETQGPALLCWVLKVNVKVAIQDVAPYSVQKLRMLCCCYRIAVGISAGHTGAKSQHTSP